MKIFLMSDIHGNLSCLGSVETFLQDADVVVLAGDITHSGERGEAEEILEKIEKLNGNIIAVHGNWDSEEIGDMIRERGYSVHGTGKIIGQTGFFGVGGSSPTPMHTRCEYNDERIREFLEEGYRFVEGTSRKVLVSHTPPRKTKDRTFLGLRAGSQALRDFILEYDISLCLCGHIHEARGNVLLGGCLVANAGAFKGGRYMTLDLGETVTVAGGKAAKSA